MSRYEVGYLWVESTPSLTKKIGLTRHGLEHIGDIQWIGFPSPGTPFDQRDTLFVVESSKAAIEVESPLKGTIVSSQTCTEELLSSLKANPDQQWLVEVE